MAGFHFDSRGHDAESFLPFVLMNYGEFRPDLLSLQFNNWDWLHGHLGSDTIDGYYLNGYGVEGVVKAALFEAGLDPDDARLDYDSEGDTCVLMITDGALAAWIGPVSAHALRNAGDLSRLIAVARAHGWED